MRRKEKEITGITAMEAIIAKAVVCRLALSDDGQPYIVPMCFGYKPGYLFFHCAKQGMKMDILRKNSKVCAELEIGVDVRKGEEFCKWGMRYQSVIAMGEIEILEDIQEKTQALDVIMAQYADQPFSYPEKSVKNTAVLKMKISQMTGKQSE